MNTSKEQAEALNSLIDELQGREPAGRPPNLDLKTTQVVHELHRLAIQTPTRTGFVQQLERSLEGQRDARGVAPMRAAIHALPDTGVARSDSVWRFKIRLPGAVPIGWLHTAAIAVLVIAVIGILAVMLRNVGSRSVGGQPSSATPAPLVAVFGKDPNGNRLSGYSIHALNPDTLADASGTIPFEAGPCGAPPVLDSHQTFAAVALTGNAGNPTACPNSSHVQLRVIDLRKWAWGPEIDLQVAPDRSLELASTLVPMIWNPDGSKLFLFSVSRARDWIAAGTEPDEQRQLWIVDVQGNAAPIAIQLDVAVWDVAVAPTGHAIYILGYDTLGPSGLGFFKPGSTILEAIDASTGGVLSRVPLPGVKLATQAPSGRTYVPATALTQSGRYYFVAHADEPVIDVVDVFAPARARVERTLQIDSQQETSMTDTAWLGVSPDGRRLFAHRFTRYPYPDAPVRSPVPLQVIDVGAWSINTFDTLASYLRFSADGQYVYAIDAPDRSAAGSQSFDPSNAPGAGLRVLNVAGQLVTRLMADRFPSVVAPVGSNRLYVVHPGADFARQFAGNLPAPRIGQDVYDLVAYELGSWREMARRSWHLPISLAATN